MPFIQRLARCLAIVIPGFCADLVSKELALRYLKGDTVVELIPGGVVKLQLARNAEGFLGMLSGMSDPLRTRLLTFGVAFALMAVVAILCMRRPPFGVFVAGCLVVSGGAANLADRILHEGAVTDFLLIGIGPLVSGIFNPADLLIFIGSFSLGCHFATRT